MALLSALVCLALALFIGGWRSYCRYCEREAAWNLPLGWHNPAVQWGSFLIVAAASVWACLVGATLVGEVTGTFIGKFSFGVLLSLRWMVSGLFGFQKAKADVAHFEADYRKRHGDE